MADVDIDPSEEHESRSEEPTEEHIPLDPVTPVGGGRSTWEPDRGEQETSFGGESQRTKLLKDYVKDLYKRLSENIGETPELFHYDYFKLEGGELYYIGSRKPLTTEEKLKLVGMLVDILGKKSKKFEVFLDFLFFEVQFQFKISSSESHKFDFFHSQCIVAA